MTFHRVVPDFVIQAAIRAVMAKADRVSRFATN
jgi:hypothetical protein